MPQQDGNDPASTNPSSERSRITYESLLSYQLHWYFTVKLALANQCNLDTI